MLGAHDHGAPAHRQVTQDHPLLQLSRGEHPGRSVPRDEPGGPWPLPGPGGQEHGTGTDHLDPAGSRQE